MTQQELPIPAGNALARPRPRTGGRIAALAAALWLCMLPSRAMIMGYITPDDLQPPELHQIPELIPTYNLPANHHYIGAVLWSGFGRGWIGRQRGGLLRTS